MVNPLEDYLLPEVRELLKLDTSERIRYLEKDTWIGYPRAKQLLESVQNHFKYVRFMV